LLVFNKTRDSAAVRQKMHEVMQARQEYRRTISYDPNGDARYIFVKESDPGREIIITTQLYDIPISLDFGHSPRNQVAGKWQAAEGLIAGAWEAT
jgi:hypothetical protein